MFANQYPLEPVPTPGDCPVGAGAGPVGVSVGGDGGCDRAVLDRWSLGMPAGIDDSGEIAGMAEVKEAHSDDASSTKAGLNNIFATLMCSQIS